MKNLHVHNPHFITYTHEVLTVDILGGVDLSQFERMVCTLRVSYQNYPPLRSTLDLYNDTQTDKLIRTICDKWELKLHDVSTSIYALIQELEEYRFSELKQSGSSKAVAFEMNETEIKIASDYLKDKNLIQNLRNDFKHIGILGEDENALILFLAMASHRYENPFSVICLAKSGIGKSHILQKLSQCLPPSSFSFHTQISENALYYFDNRQIDEQVLFIEDLDFTHQMLMPLSTLQTQGKLIKTRTTKNKDGLLHSTTFELAGRLCMLACAYNEINYEKISLPFLCLNLNHSPAQDLEIMNYQRAMSAGLIDKTLIVKTQQRLQCVIASLENVSIINPFAPLIELPADIPHPRKTLLLLLDFINVVTFFHQAQRAQKINEQTGEVYIETAPEDVELAFSLLKNSLLRRADELSTSARGFYVWLQKYLAEAKTTQFTTLDIRKARSVHPRTLNRYLHELSLFQYIQISGGNKYRGGFIYRLTHLDDLSARHVAVETSLQNTLQRIGDRKQVEISTNETVNNPRNSEEKTPAFLDKDYKRIRINEKEKYTFRLLLELEKENPGREYLSTDLTAVSKRSRAIEGRYLKTLWEQGTLNREWRDRQYFYTLVTTSSQTVSQNAETNS